MLEKITQTPTEIENIIATEESLETESLSATEDPFEIFKKTYFEQKEALNAKTQEIIDRLEQTKNDIMHSLTSVPIHPYDRLKHEYLGDNYIPIDIDSITVPENYCPDTTIRAITALGEKYDELADCQIQTLSSRIENNETIDDTNIGNVFTVLSGDSFVIDKSKMKSHLEFLEFLKNVPVYKIEQNPELVCKKILTQYLKSY